mgnify:FL=1
MQNAGFDLSLARRALAPYSRKGSGSYVRFDKILELEKAHEDACQAFRDARARVLREARESRLRGEESWREGYDKYHRRCEDAIRETWGSLLSVAEILLLANVYARRVRRPTYKWAARNAPALLKEMKRNRLVR